MDAWHRTFDQLRTVVRGLSVTQRASLLVVTLGMLAAIGWFAFGEVLARDEFLLGGKDFSTEELSRTQAALKTAGLLRARVVGRKISVPAAEADRYTAAALAQQTLPAQFAAEFDRMQSKVNVFTSTEQRRELLEEARKTRLAQILRAIPEIEDAVVEWDRPKATSMFRPAPQLAAHVSVRPRGGAELSPELVQSLKQFIAGALAGAETDDVTVVDMNTSRVYGRRSAESAASDRTDGLAKQQASEYSSRITQALQYIPEVLVSVNVELLPETGDADFGDGSRELEQPFLGTDFVPLTRRRSRDRSQEFARSNHPLTTRIDPVAATRMVRVDAEGRPAAQDFRGPQDLEDVFTPDSSSHRKSVQVAVSIPENYYSAIARTRGLSSGRSIVQDSAYRAALADIKAETQRDVRETLIRLLPRGSDPGSLSVTTYTPLKSAAEPVAEPTEGSTEYSVEACWELCQTHWKIATGAAICGLCLLWTVFRSRPKSFTEPAAVVVSEPVPQSPVPEEPELIPPPLAPQAAVLERLAALERGSPAVSRSHEKLFAFLDELSADDTARMLATEHPQTIALVATALDPAQSANILHSLPESLRWDVTQRLTRMGTAAPDVLREVAASLKSRLHQRSSGDRREFPMTAAGPAADEATDTPPTGPLIFEDLNALDFRALATVLESVDLRACAVALLDRSEAFKQALLKKMPKHVSSAIRRHLKQLGPIRLIEITASQEAIAGVAWNLAQHGMIALPEHLENLA